MRKLLTFLIALASIAFAVCSPVAAQGFNGGGQNLGLGPFIPSTGPTYVQIANGNASGSGAVLTISANIGAGSSNFVVVVLTYQGTAILASSVTVGGQTLNADDNATGRAAIFSGLVTLSGAQNIVATWASGSFDLRGLTAYTLAGLSSNTVKQHTSGSSNTLTLSVSAGDLMFAATAGVGTGPATFSGATQVPAHTTSMYSANPFGSSADWTISATNAAFLAASGVANPTVVATYR